MKLIACENIRFSSLFATGDVSRGGTSATQRQKFNTDDVKSPTAKFESFESFCINYHSVSKWWLFVDGQKLNIYEGNLEICILCGQGAVKGDRYYVRTDTNAVATELLRKIPWYLAHWFDFLTTHVLSGKQPDKFPFCCCICKKLLAKRENQVVNLSKVENCIRLRRGSSARRISFSSTDVTCSTPAHHSDPFTCIISPIAFPTTCTSSSSDDKVTTGREHHKEAHKIESQVLPECRVKVRLNEFTHFIR